MKIAKAAVLTFFALALFGAGALTAQSVPNPRISQSLTLAEPEIIAGPDVGFRVGHYTRDGVPVGELVVRKDGKWVPVEFGAKMKLTK